MGGRPKSTFKSPCWGKTIFPIACCSLPWRFQLLRDCCSVLCNNNALNFVITRASPCNNRFTPVVIARAILLLHGQYCYYTGFVLHCIKIVWVHKQPKHFDSWANVALMILSLSIQHELCPCVWVNIKSYAGVPENQLASTRKSPLLNSTSIWGMINIQLLYV
jgi:hypothetical protein